MNKTVLFLAMIFFSAVLRGDACVGKTLSIGVLDNTNEQVLAEMLSVLISERTGTTVNVRMYKDQKDLYGAVKKGEVSIFVENTGRTMDLLGRPEEEDAGKAYAISKSEYRKNWNLVWLEPLGLLTTGGGKAVYYTPVIALNVLENFPALPRVINKLSGVINDEVYGKLVESSKSGNKPKKAARDFLKAKKLI